MNHRSFRHKLSALSPHLFPAPLVARPVDARDEDELEDAAEHEDHAGQHPDVEEGDVGDPGHALSDGAEHGREGEQGGHSHANSSRHGLGGDEHRQPTKDLG